MSKAPAANDRAGGEKVVDFDEVLLDACPARERDELMAEADLLARVFAPQGRGPEIAELARTVQSSVPHLRQGRAYARRLVAALRRLAGRSR
jgi:hypothetical protein